MYFQTFPGQKDKFITNLYFSDFSKKLRKTPHFSRLFELLPTLTYDWKYSFIPSLAVLFRHWKSFLLVLLIYI